MTKLMKYELNRRKHMLIGAAITMLFLEWIALLGIYNGGGWRAASGGGWNGWNILAVGMTALLVIGGFALTTLDAVTRLYSDYKQKHGYMLFMTPQSGYRIIWAKTVFALLEILAAGLIIAGCLALSCMALEHVYGAVSIFFANPPIDIGVLINLITSGGILGLLQIMAQLSIALLAVTVSRAVTQGSSYNWLIALAMYFALAVVVNVGNSYLLLAFGVVGDVLRINNGIALIDSGLLTKYLIIGAVTYSAWFTGCTLLSGRLINRGMDI
jgi:ABC-2 type transport system permease protein